MAKYARDTFNGQRGLHFEIDDECIKYMEGKDIPCVQADVTNLTLPENCVDFVIATGTIEHLMDLEAVKKMIEMSAKAATDFVYLTWPWFDSDDYLKDLGFIPFPSSWPIHSCHVTISDLKNILKELSLEGVCMAWPPIPDSSYYSILPIDYPFILKNSDLNTVNNMFQLVINDYNNNKVLWNKGLMILKDIKAKLELNTLVYKYLTLLNM